MKIPPWSYSAISTFENCPKQYYHRYILKQKEPDTVQTKHGTEVHKALEDRINGVRLPEAYLKYEPLCKSIDNASRGAIVKTEMPFALDEKFLPVDFFSPKVWGRGKADIVVQKAEVAWVGDWKTGKVRENKFQLQVFAAFVFKLMPHINKVHCNNIWLKENKIGESYVYTRERGEDAIWSEILRKISRMELAAEKEAFDPKPSGLCGWCSVKTCPHNGDYNVH